MARPCPFELVRTLVGAHAKVTSFCEPRRRLRPTPVVILILALGYFGISALTGLMTNGLSYVTYGDSTITGRQRIRDFAIS